jgi:DNA polymerase-3 subunit epsilon
VPLNFTAIDFETANRYSASPCAVGLVRVRDGKIVDGLALLFRPPGQFNWFDAGNIAIHGITQADVDAALSYEEAHQQMIDFIDGDLLIAHNAPFDMGVLKAAAEEAKLELPEYLYTCSLEISRKVYHLESYRLNSVAYAIGHEEFKHHDALADADACARIIIHAADRQGVETVQELVESVAKKIKSLSA